METDKYKMELYCHSDYPKVVGKLQAPVSFDDTIVPNERRNM